MRIDGGYHTEYKKLALYALIGFFFLLLGIFGYHKTKHIWQGVPLELFSPKTGDSVPQGVVQLEGVAPRAIHLVIQGDETFIGEQGEFSYPLVIHLGYNEIHVHVEDKFGNKKERVLQINGI